MSRPGKGSSRCFELNHMLHRLCGPPSIPLSFNLAVVLPRRVLNALAAALKGGNPPTLSTHRLRRGLPGVSNPVCSPRFRASASVTDQSRLRHWCVLHISTHFTATHGIPLSSSALQVSQFPMTLPG